MTENNPQAFPSHYEILQREMIEVKVLKVLRSKDGMTLRDYFAGQALSILAGKYFLDKDSDEITARRCYKYADAMLIEREKSK